MKRNFTLWLLVFAIFLLSACTPTPSRPAGTPPDAEYAVRIPVLAAGAVNDNLSYTVYQQIAPMRLEFTLLNSRSFDIEAVKASFSGLNFVKDVYQTTVLDDSMHSFTVELSRSMSMSHPGKITDGCIDLTFTETSQDDDYTVYTVRSTAKDNGEDLAILSESAYGLGTSAVKTQSGSFCIIAAVVMDDAEANDILLAINSDEFFIEESTVFSSPK